MARSGRSVSSRASRSSGQLRSWSASVRCRRAPPAGAPGRHPSPYATRRAPARAAHSPASARKGMSTVELHHGAATDVGPGPQGQRGLLPRRPAGLRGGRRHGRSRGRRRRQPDRRRGVRPARRGGYDPRRGAEPSRTPSTRARPGSPSTPTSSGRAPARLARRHHRRGRAARRGRRHPKWLLANLGDSRIYRFVDGRLDQVSVDHSVVQELVDAGPITREEMPVHPERHVVTRALGSPTAPTPTSSCCRCPRSSGSCCAPTASPG